MSEPQAPVVASNKLLAARFSEIECETCEGTGTIDERIGGYSFSNPAAKCPDCDGAGYWIPANPTGRATETKTEE